MQNSAEKVPTPFEYMNYRLYLKDAWSNLKEKNPRFSYRIFNRTAGFRSPGFLKMVIDSKRNLADDGIDKVARGLQLNDSEMNYFGSLVKFNQAQTHENKDRFFRMLLDHKQFMRAKPLAEAQYRLFSHWYYVVILELVRLESKEIKNLRWLHVRLKPEIQWGVLKKAVKELKTLGLLTVEKNGSLQRRDEMLTTPDEVKSVGIGNIHAQLCDMAKLSLLNDAPNDREFSGLTIALSEKGFLLLKKEIQKFRKKIHSALEAEKDPKTLVGHLNMQLFSFTRRTP